MDRRDRFASRDGETAQLLAMRGAFQNGSPVEQAEARRWFAAYDARMGRASAPASTRVPAPAAPPAVGGDEETERLLESLLASYALDEGLGL